MILGFLPQWQATEVVRLDFICIKFIGEYDDHKLCFLTKCRSFFIEYINSKMNADVTILRDARLCLSDTNGSLSSPWSGCEFYSASPVGSCPAPSAWPEALWCSLSTHWACRFSTTPPTTQSVRGPAPGSACSFLPFPKELGRMRQLVHLNRSRDNLGITQMRSCRCFPGLGFYVTDPVLPLWMVCLPKGDTRRVSCKLRLSWRWQAVGKRSKPMVGSKPEVIWPCLQNPYLV